MVDLPTQKTMWRAFREKDSQFDGLFFVAVRTTGIFCRPVCRARPPRRENVEFFASASEAMRQGYRACKLCRPGDGAAAAAPPETVRRLAALAQSRGDEPIRGRDLTELGIDASTARRQFRRYFGVTFAGYQRAVRMGVALAEVRGGAPVVSAQVSAGFESSSGFRRAFASSFGVPASRGAGVEALTEARFDTPLGAMLGIASAEGLVVLDFVDRKGLPKAIERVRTNFGRDGAPAAVAPGENRYLAQVGRELAEYFDGRRREFSVPLAVSRGTEFERRAWEFLRGIPFGQTRSYGEQARDLGRPGAARAVGRANGMNFVSIVIPCHRVVGAGGALTGYGGGLWRKRWLLEHERRRVRGVRA